MTRKTHVSLTNISKIFYPLFSPPIVAIKDISEEIEYGEFVVVVGRSGCGKTTLLRIVADLISPTTGSVEIDGHPASYARQHLKIGFVFQQSVLLPWRNAKQNVLLPFQVARRSLSVSEHTWGDKAIAMLRLVGLEEFKDALPSELSGGMQQRISLARALVMEPSLLLMDEPFGALDHITRTELNFELMSIWERTKQTVIFVTHSIEEAVFLADRVLYMSPSPGRFVERIHINLPRPRTLDTKRSNEYHSYCNLLMDALHRDGEGK